jgi:predicted nucleotide-binding protein
VFARIVGADSWGGTQAEVEALRRAVLDSRDLINSFLKHFEAVGQETTAGPIRSRSAHGAALRLAEWMLEEMWKAAGVTVPWSETSDLTAVGNAFPSIKKHFRDLMADKRLDTPQVRDRLTPEFSRAWTAFPKKGSDAARTADAPETKDSAGRKPRLFVGSSRESLRIAGAVQAALDHDLEVTVRHQGIFEPSATTIESLEEALGNFDFALFVFSPDDLTIMRGKKHQTVRDNVIFETGLFAGRLGRKRVFFLVPRGPSQPHLPTDLLGVTPLTFEPKRSDETLNAAVGPACEILLTTIKKRHPRK